jgi:hypothetical protein
LENHATTIENTLQHVKELGVHPQQEYYENNWWWKAHGNGSREYSPTYHLVSMPIEFFFHNFSFTYQISPKIPCSCQHSQPPSIQYIN